ncbi:unnamed protein product [Eruca vesicaria subsp. sativa]|uniref:Uncharacterized protein n=1 Tax=Eruca vesicaria subsp. sativa TaxID=29727 RepID=A0ABC8KQZ6_ERUVS|nr:unnamed protein product [Eruca vesicaria subsp. sativa]
MPWACLDIDLLEALLFDGNAPEISESVACDARVFIETCFARNPEERGSASELLLHRFLHPQEEGEKVISVVAAGKKRDSLSLRINKSTDITKKPLKEKIFPSNPPKSKKILNSLVRLKIMLMMKRSVSKLVSVQ